MTGSGDQSRGAAGEFSPPLDAEAASALDRYVGALESEGQTLNLTAATTRDEILGVLVRPSLGVHRAWERPAPPRLALDLGSGNGFPGVAVALLWPEAHVLLVERRGKKARAIARCLAVAGIPNAEALALDAREVRRERPDVAGAVDLLTVRAVGPLDRTTRIAAPLLAPGGRLVHWKAADLDADERSAGARAARAAGLAVVTEHVLERSPGRLVCYERPESTS